MGLVDSFFATTVLKYKVDAAAAVRDIKNLSKEQQKAAKEAAAGIQEQGKNAEMLGAKYARAAGAVAGLYLAATKGLEALDKQSKLSAGSMGVDIGKLSEAAGGLRTEWELMEIAQAGSRGAMKLTTQQIGYVIEGMRALEKQGFDAKEVQEELTKAMIEGKLEGLDKFGLGLKTTGDRAADTKTLMSALRAEVREVGGDFDKANDAAKRSAVTLQNVLKDIQVWLGRATQASLRFAESVGRWAGQKVYGDLPEATTRDNADFLAKSAQRFALAGSQGVNRANALSLLSTDDAYAESGGLGLAQLQRLGNFQLPQAGAADRAAAARAEQIYSDLRRGIYKTLGPEALSSEIAKLPEAWERARPDLKRLTDKTFQTLEVEWTAKAKTVGRELAQGFLVGFDDMNQDIRAGRAAKAGAGPKGDFYGNLLERGKLFAGRVSARAEASDAELMRLAEASLTGPGLTFDQERGLAQRAAERDPSQSAGIENIIAGIDRFASEYAKGQEKSLLAKVFGPVDEFKLYEEALTSLSDVTQSALGGIYSTWANGGELTAKAIKKMIAASIAAEGQQLLATGIRYTLTGIGTAILSPGTGGAMIAAGAGMIAGAATLGGIARAMGGGDSGSTGAGASGASARARNQDHRGGGQGGNGWAGDSRIIVLSGIHDDESPLYRDRRARDVSRRAEGSPRPEGSSRS